MYSFPLTMDFKLYLVTSLRIEILSFATNLYYIMIIGRINEYKTNISSTQLANQICIICQGQNVNYDATLPLI